MLSLSLLKGFSKMPSLGGGCEGKGNRILLSKGKVGLEGTDY